jgi:rhodanese-related sulfurtransferase
MTPNTEISPAELKVRLDAGPPVDVLDVREEWEHALGALPGARLIPMEELPGRLDELSRERELVVYCHHGIRSAAAVEWLRRQAIPAVNLLGGIDAWAAEIDPGLPRY